MKTLAMFLSVVAMSSGLLLAEDKPAAKPAEKAPVAGAAAAKTHEVAAEVVSADVVKNMLTVKGEKDNKTVPVEGKAIASLKTVKAGDKVTLVCRDNEKGEHQAVTEIKPAAKDAPAAAPAPAK